MPRDPEVKDVVGRLIQSSVSPHLADDAVFPFGFRFADLFKQPLELQVSGFLLRHLAWHQHAAAAFIESDCRILLNSLGHEGNQAKQGEVDLLDEILQGGAIGSPATATEDVGLAIQR